MNNRVYLCGPISGLTAEEAVNNWRTEAAFKLDHVTIPGIRSSAWPLRLPRMRVLSPMRFKTNLPPGKLPPEGFTDLGPLYTNRGIFGRDRNDVRTSDVVLAYFAGAERVSIGSMIELGWADAWNIPVVAVLDPLHDHVFVKQVATAVCKDLDEAVQATLSILGIA